LKLSVDREQLIGHARTAAIFALIYLAADSALNRFAFSDGWTILWPLNGVTVAVLLMRPRTAWVPILLGVECGTGLGEFWDGNPLLLELGQRLCSLVEVVVCATILPPCTSVEAWLRTSRIHLRFLAALLLGPGLSGLLAAILFHIASGQSYLLAFNNWATADALGITSTLPLALTIRSAQMRALFRPAGWKATLGILLLTFCGSVLIFTVSHYPLLFLLYPTLLLVDSFLGFAGFSIAIVVVDLVAVYCTTHALGPFGAWDPKLGASRDFALQVYLGFHVTALLPFSVVLMERRRMAQELQLSNARLTALASLDGLTGIANRRIFEQRFAEEWARAQRTGAPLALAIVDLDHFKQYNDVYGHPAGDRCLRVVAEALQGEMLRSDELAVRYGGEEFAALLPNMSAEGACEVAERVRAAVLNLNIKHLGNPWNRVSVSVGYASVIPTLADPPVGLVQLADAALYRAKREGRNRVATITSMETLRAADHFSDTTNVRIMRLLRRTDQ